MPMTPNRGWVYPTESQNPYFETIEDFFLAQDTDMHAAMTGVRTVPTGGTGASTLTSGAYLKGAGTGAITTQAVPIPATEGGTGQTAYAKGDILAATSSTALGRVTPVGANETVLTADSTQSTGVAWVLPMLPMGCQGRLTLESGVPLSTTDQTSKSTLYLTPHRGHGITLYDGTRWKGYTFTEPSLALSGLTVDKNYDVFAFVSGSTVTLELGPAWTNDTTRATALVRQNGLWVKSGATTRLYLGTLRAVTATTTHDTVGARFLYNEFNRAPRLLSIYQNTPHSYASATYRMWNNDATLVTKWVRGSVGAPIVVTYFLDVLPSTATARAHAGFALDTTSGIYGGNLMGGLAAEISQNGIWILTESEAPVGYHFVAAQQAAVDSVSITFYLIYITTTLDS
jgi:hypothetical protein